MELTTPNPLLKQEGVGGGNSALISPNQLGGTYNLHTHSRLFCSQSHVIFSDCGRC